MNVTVSPDLIYTVLPPPLIFEAALPLKWRPFRDDLPVTVTLAFPGVLLAGAIIATGMHLVAGWGWLGSALFGALIAPPIRSRWLPPSRRCRSSRLNLLVESYSLLNDGAAAVAFAILVAIAHGAGVQGTVVGVPAVGGVRRPRRPRRRRRLAAAPDR